MEDRELQLWNKQNGAMAHEDNGDMISESSHGRNDDSLSPPSRSRTTGETVRAQVRVKVCAIYVPRTSLADNAQSSSS